jgi:MFS transporter, MHS family, proline/betaine transporter
VLRSLSLKKPRFFLALNDFTKKTRVFLWVSSGTVLEYYDYALYGLFAQLFAQDFFPDQDPTLGLFKTFGIFWLGSMAKPLGSWVFGCLGNRRGVAYALKISILGVALATIAMAIVPGYAAIGWIAPSCLFIGRIIQSMCVAGETDSARIFIYENIGSNRPCLISSLSSLAWKLGFSLASLAYASVMLSTVPLAYYRWPFILGGCLGLFIFFCRRNLDVPQNNTYYLMREKKEHPSENTIPFIRKHKKIISCTLLLCGSVGGSYHFYFSFLTNYFELVPDLHEYALLWRRIPLMLFYTLGSLAASLIADRMGTLNVMKGSSYLLLILSLSHVIAIMAGIFPMALAVLTVIALAAFQAPAFISLFERVSADKRCQSIAIGHALGSFLFSGSTPMISLGLWQKTGWMPAPFLYFIFLVGLGFFGLSLLKQEAIVS